MASVPSLGFSVNSLVFSIQFEDNKFVFFRFFIPKCKVYVRGIVWCCKVISVCMCYDSIRPLHLCSAWELCDMKATNSPVSAPVWSPHSVLYFCLSNAPSQVLCWGLTFSKAKWTATVRLTNLEICILLALYMSKRTEMFFSLSSPPFWNWTLLVTGKAKPLVIFKDVWQIGTGHNNPKDLKNSWTETSQAILFLACSLGQVYCVSQFAGKSTALCESGKKKN